MMFDSYRIVSGGPLGPKKIPRFMYSGMTIGPVPSPKSESREQFIRKIGEYLIESISLGWISDQELPSRLQKDLTDISNRDLDPAQITGIFTNINDTFRSNQLREEANVLLKYNLLYLINEQNWN